MAVTATLVAHSPYHQRYLLAHNAAGANSVIITAANLLANALAGPMREMPGIGEDIVGLNTAGARKRMLGDGIGATDLTSIRHCICRITPRSGANVWNVDADTDAVNALRCELNITAEAVAASAYLDVEYQHSLNS